MFTSSDTNAGLNATSDLPVALKTFSVKEVKVEWLSLELKKKTGTDGFAHFFSEAASIQSIHTGEIPNDWKSGTPPLQNWWSFCFELLQASLYFILCTSSCRKTC